jgi:signal peptidase II
LVDRTFIRGYGRPAWLIILGMVLLFIDFVTKAYVYHVLFYSSRAAIPVFTNFAGIDFFISLAYNKGAAWGVLANFQTPLLVLRILIILGIFIYLFFLNHNRIVDLPLVFIIAGAIGNVIDFFLYGFVVDFLRFNLWGYHFPIFNFADSWITIGVVWLLLAGIISKNHSKYA